MLTLGPVLYFWDPEAWRDFYFSMADEAPLDRVYVGEAVCAKRAPFTERYLTDVIARLERGGKEVVRTTLAEGMSDQDRALVSEQCRQAGTRLIEANDAAALYHLRGEQHAVGPFVNVYNEATLAWLVQQGATHATLSPEFSRTNVAALAQTARSLGASLEVQVYGRIPLALSARCYHARAHGRTKSNCRFVCGRDPDGMALETLDGDSFLVVNGIQTQSYAYLNMMHELTDIRHLGVQMFRLSPHSGDMREIAHLFREVAAERLDPDEATARLHAHGPNVPFANGFYHGVAGDRWLPGGAEPQAGAADRVS